MPSAAGTARQTETDPFKEGKRSHVTAFQHCSTSVGHYDRGRGGGGGGGSDRFEVNAEFGLMLAESIAFIIAFESSPLIRNLRKVNLTKSDSGLENVFICFEHLLNIGM